MCGPGIARWHGRRRTLSPTRYLTEQPQGRGADAQDHCGSCRDAKGEPDGAQRAAKEAGLPTRQLPPPAWPAARHPPIGSLGAISTSGFPTGLHGVPAADDSSCSCVHEVAVCLVCIVVIAVEQRVGQAACIGTRRSEALVLLDSWSRGRQRRLVRQQGPVRSALSRGRVLDVAGIVPGEERVEQALGQLRIHVTAQAPVEFALERSRELELRRQLREDQVGEALEGLPVADDARLQPVIGPSEARQRIPPLHNGSPLSGEPNVLEAQAAESEARSVKLGERLRDRGEDRHDLTGREGVGPVEQLPHAGAGRRFEYRNGLSVIRQAHIQQHGDARSADLVEDLAEFIQRRSPARFDLHDKLDGAEERRGRTLRLRDVCGTG